MAFFYKSTVKNWQYNCLGLIHNLTKKKKYSTKIHTHFEASLIITFGPQVLKKSQYLDFPNIWHIWNIYVFSVRFRNNESNFSRQGKIFRVSVTNQWHIRSSTVVWKSNGVKLLLTPSVVLEKPINSIVCNSLWKFISWIFFRKEIQNDEWVARPRHAMWQDCGEDTCNRI